MLVMKVTCTNPKQFTSCLEIKKKKKNTLIPLPIDPE